ncbi:MAG: DUF5615 family PIN-like protein [Hyphomicrobiales bacterium]|nr:DUF5615 family PIN-like protein [Hyphomicrobiales bacterium]
MKLLVDMNLSPRWVKALIEAEIEASHWSTLGPANASDADIMAFARANGYVVLTHDLDFSAILAATKTQSRAWFKCARMMSDLKRWVRF